MNDFDLAARYALKDAPQAHIRWFLPKLDRCLRFADWLDSQSAPRPGEPERRCDTIAALHHEEGLCPPWALVLESFTGPDPDAIDRTLEYLGRFRRELRHGPHGHDRYAFAAVLLFLTGTPGDTALDMTLPGEDEVGLRWSPRVVDLQERSALALLNAIEQNEQPPALLVWVPVMKGGQTAEAAARWRALAERLPDDNRRRTLADLVLIFAQLSDSVAVWRKALEVFNVNESIILREARQAGHKKGAAESGRAFLFRFLRKLNQGELPAALQERIDRQDDPVVLAAWFDKAVAASSFEAFLASLD